MHVLPREGLGGVKGQLGGRARGCQWCDLPRGGHRVALARETIDGGSCLDLVDRVARTRGPDLLDVVDRARALGFEGAGRRVELLQVEVGQRQRGRAAAGIDAADRAPIPDQRRAVAGGGERRPVELSLASGHVVRVDVTQLSERLLEVQGPPTPVGLPAGLGAHRAGGSRAPLTRGVDEDRLLRDRLTDAGPGQKRRRGSALRGGERRAAAAAPEVAVAQVMLIGELAAGNRDQVRLLAPARAGPAAGEVRDGVVARVDRGVSFEAPHA